MVSYCMDCGRVKFSGNEGWQYPELNLINYRISHGYCPPCCEKVIAETKKEIERMKNENT